MMEFFYKLKIGETQEVVLIETNCPEDEFTKTVQFIKSLDNYDIDLLLAVVRALSWKAEYYEPNVVTGEYWF